MGERAQLRHFYIFTHLQNCAKVMSQVSFLDLSEKLEIGSVLLIHGNTA